MDPWTYADLDRRQREIAKGVLGGQPGKFLLSEVAPVITTGRRPCAQDILLPEEQLAAMGVPICKTDRGGMATWHGPGQWILFAVDSLESLTRDRRGVRKAVEGLLEVALEAGREWDSTAEIRTGAETGVWLKEGKFASVGVHIDQGVLLHGLSVNGFATALSFKGLRPCGLDLPVAWLLRRGEEGGFEKLGQSLATRALKRFRPGLKP